MNTDNMSVAGETIDYGPCAFMDTFDPATVFSSIDEDGRYSYGNQPRIARWNLARLAEALLPLLASEADEAITIAEEALADSRRSSRQPSTPGFDASSVSSPSNMTTLTLHRIS